MPHQSIDDTVVVRELANVRLQGQLQGPNLLAELLVGTLDAANGLVTITNSTATL